MEQSIEQRRNRRRVPEKLPPVIHRAARGCAGFNSLASVAASLC